MFPFEWNNCKRTFWRKFVGKDQRLELENLTPVKAKTTYLISSSISSTVDEGLGEGKKNRKCAGQTPTATRSFLPTTINFKGLMPRRMTKAK